jgi:NDP-sugar pyrophosphorylase family protein
MGTTIVYIVAGLSSRFGGKTKAFAEVGPNGETLIEYSLNQALLAGFSKIIFVVSEKTEKLFKEKFGDNYKGIPISYTFQKYDSEKRDKPWGTGDAICSAIDLINEPFVVCTGDDIYGKKTFEILFNYLNTQEDEITITKNLIEMLPEGETVNRGVFEIENEYVIESKEHAGINRENFIEKGCKEDTPVSISIFGLHPKTLQFLKEDLDKFKQENKEDRKIEFFLNTRLAELIKENKIKMKAHYTPEKWFGITNPGDELKVRDELKNI